MATAMVDGSQLSITYAIKGKTGQLRDGGLWWPIRVLDARKVWGRVDVLIQPISGKGQRWIEQSRVVLDD